MGSNWVYFLTTLAFLYSVRPRTMPLPLTGHSLSQLQDQLWDFLAPSSDKTSRAFDERFGFPYEKYQTLIGQLAQDIVSGARTQQLTTPYLGEPLSIAAVVRQFPYIRRLSVSPLVTQQQELYQRLFEGLYPVLVDEVNIEQYRLVTAAEVGTCEVLAIAKEAHLVRCP